MLQEPARLTNSAVLGKRVLGTPAVAKTLASDVSSGFAAGGAMLTEPKASTTLIP
jgi:hypothetical protein